MTHRRCRRPPLVLVVLLVLVTTLAACTGVPTSSAPQIVKTLPIGGGVPQNPITPVPGMSPYALVNSFLDANALGDGKHASARTFLTAAARNSWNDSTATVVQTTDVGGYVPGKPIVVRGRELGSIDARGVYTPTLQGSSAPLVQFLFDVAKTPDGQYRIGKLHNGVVVNENQFLTQYSQQSLYYFDLAQRYLVPDPRWTSINDGAQLASWLTNQLADGPSDLLSNAVSTDTLPAQAANANLTVTFGSTIKVEIPGSSQLDGGARDRLAAQIAVTLAEAAHGRTFTITDGGTPVPIPDASGSEFSASEFGDTSLPPPSPEVYYLRGGRVVDGRGIRLPGAIASTPYFLSSVAASRSDPGGALALAGVATLDGAPTLLVGSQAGGLRPTTVRGVTSRPAYAPDRDEVWVGAGTTIMRVSVSGRTVTADQVALPASANGGRIVALRLSPEGSRIAVVLQDSSGRQQLDVGAVVRTNGQVRVDTLQQVSPSGVVVTDLAWVERLKLYAIGYDTPSDDARLYSTGVDGSGWDAQSIGALPDPPSTLSISLGQPGWVTAGDSVWRQSGGSTWDSPGPGAKTPGTAPTYVE